MSSLPNERERHMKITSVECYKGPFITVKMNTDEGISGFGEAGLSYGCCQTAAWGNCQDFAKLVIGMEMCIRDRYRKEIWISILKFLGILKISIRILICMSSMRSVSYTHLARRRRDLPGEREERCRSGGCGCDWWYPPHDLARGSQPLRWRPRRTHAPQVRALQ